MSNRSRILVLENKVFSSSLPSSSVPATANNSHNSLISPPHDWIKPVREEAYHGIPGAIVKIIEPHSEADPVALLIQLLAVVGNIVGNKCYFKTEEDVHSLKIYPVLVGKTSKSRKGTSWGRINKICDGVDHDWAEKHVLTGLASGEGLIAAVGGMQDSDMLGKRLLIIEPEFASTLKVMSREGNILSPIIRQAWDSNHLANLTKNNPLHASDVHITIIGHITKDELVRYLNELEMANGFGNRLLWVCVKRSRYLPDGGNLKMDDLKPLIDRLVEVKCFSGTVTEIRRDNEANEYWHDIYNKLSDDGEGIVGALTARAEAYVMRLACIYAMLDCSSVIRPKHLYAALAIWDYAKSSVIFIFGEKIGDPTADTIVDAIRRSPTGLNRTQISGLFNRHVKTDKIYSALTLIQKCGIAKPQMIITEGRPEERWMSCAK